MTREDELEPMASLVVRLAVSATKSREAAAELLGLALGKLVVDTSPMRREGVRGAALHRFSDKLRGYGL